jgi:hypothetical protein
MLVANPCPALSKIGVSNVTGFQSTPLKPEGAKRISKASNNGTSARTETEGTEKAKRSGWLPRAGEEPARREEPWADLSDLLREEDLERAIMDEKSGGPKNLKLRARK